MGYCEREDSQHEHGGNKVEYNRWLFVGQNKAVIEICQHLAEWQDEDRCVDLTVALVMHAVFVVFVALASL